MNAPTAAMTTLNTLLGPRECSHCHGSGDEPDRPIPNEWVPVLAELVKVSRQRQKVNTFRSMDGNPELKTAIERTRELSEQAMALDVPQSVIAPCAGLSRAHLYNVIKGKMSGR